MKRIEIIANRSVEEDLFDIFNKKDIVSYYTKIPVVFGVGKSDPKMGNHIWPEENFMLIVYCEEDEADKIIDGVKELKEIFHDEGIKLFELTVDTSV